LKAFFLNKLHLDSWVLNWACMYAWVVFFFLILLSSFAWVLILQSLCNDWNLYIKKICLICKFAIYGN
jgi:hypothetical protein